MDAVLSQPAGTSSVKWKVWLGRVVSALPIVGMSISAAIKLSHQAQFVDTFVSKLGYPQGALTGIGLLELTCVALYAIPRTKILGAVLLTGYLGGAVATHVRISEPFVIPLVMGALAWLGLYLRDEKVRALSPLRS
jgi:hypothetical protein